MAHLCGLVETDIDAALQSNTLLSELLDRLGTSDFPKFLLQARVVGFPKNDGWTSAHCHELHLEDVEPSYCTTHGHLDGSLDAFFNFWCATVCRCL